MLVAWDGQVRLAACSGRGRRRAATFSRRESAGDGERGHAEALVPIIKRVLKPLTAASAN